MTKTTTIDFFYARPGCESCEKVRAELERRGTTIRAERSTKQPMTADEAGAYSTYTQDGASGTVTYSHNGGAFAALSGTIVLAVGDTVQVKRTTYTAAGWSRW